MGAPHLVIERRTFLKAIGVAAVGVAGVQRALAASGGVDTSHEMTTDQLGSDAITTQADDLDYDVERIFRFVADEIAYEPYAGVLRGPVTTLAGRAGNAADKAVLLAALLGASSIDTRFILGTLDDDAASRVAAITVDVAGLRARALAAMAGAAPASTSGAAPAPAASPQVQAILDRASEIDASVTAWAARSIDSTVEAIMAALASAGIRVRDNTADQATATERARHLWVQAASGAEWLDLDPTLPGSDIGTTLGAPTGAPVATIPDDLRHRIDLTIIGEHVAGDGLAEETLLEHSVFADELPDAPILLAHVKPQGLQGTGVKIGSMLTDGVRYQPVIQVGPRAIIGVSGLLISGDPTDPFSTGGASGREGEATGEWLEIRITSPDGTTTTARRTLLDRVGDMARQAGAFDPGTLPVAELVDLDADHPDEYLPLTTIRHLSIATGGTAWPEADTAAGQEGTALGFPARMYHVTRDVANATLSADRGVAIHIPAPNVVMHSYELQPDPAGPMKVTESLDLLHRSFLGRPVTGSAPAAPAGVLAGVTSHVSERLRGGAGLPTDLAPVTPGLSVGAIFEQAMIDGVALRVLQGSVPADLGYPPEAAVHLAEALASGWVAIAPERPVQVGNEPRLGWWLVDPATSATIDMLDDGRGVEMVEAIAFMVVGAGWQAQMVLLAKCLRGGFGQVALSLELGGTVRTVALCKR